MKPELWKLHRIWKSIQDKEFSVKTKKNHNNQANRYLILLNKNAKSETRKGRLLFSLTYRFFFLKQNTTVKVQRLWPNEKIADPGVQWKHMQ